MPRISRIVAKGKKEEELVPLMIKIGRIQLMIVGLLTVGFISFGRSFILEIWNKPDFSQSYICAVLVILPSFFYLPMQIANTTVIVENKVKLQSYVYIAMGIVNVALSLVLSKFYGAIGASVSILAAYMLRTVLMTVIYKKVLKLNMKLFFKETFLKLSPYLIITLAVGLLCEYYNPINSAFVRFGVNGIILVSVFFVLMMLKGFNQYEKNMVSKVTHKLLKK